MWVVSKESRKLQSPLFDPQMMVRPKLQDHSGFASLATFWIRLDRATRRISLGQVLDCINSFYAEHGVQVPTIIDVLVLQSNATVEPSFLLCMASLKSLAQLASDLQPRGLLRVKLGMDFFIQLGHAPTAAIQQEVVSLKPQAPATVQQRQAFGDAARRVSSPKRQRSDSISMDGAEIQDLVRPVTFENPAEWPGPEVTPPRQPVQNTDLVAGQGVNPSALAADPTPETMDVVEDTASSRGSEVDETATEATELDPPEDGRDLSQPDQLASNFPAKPHACAITAIAVSVLATTVPFLLTEQRMADLLRDPTVQDLVSHSLEETIKEDTFNCPRHLGIQVMSAWKAVLEADGGPPPPEAMLPLHVVIPFLPPGAILLFPREGVRGFWIEMIPIGGPLLPGDVATALEMSPILVVYTATSQEGVAHLDTISKLDWEVRSRLAHQVIENPDAFEQGTVTSIPSEEMRSLCGSRCPGQSHKETQTDLTGAVVSAPDVITSVDQLDSRFPHPQYACGLAAFATGVLYEAKWLTEERTRDCLDDVASGCGVDSWLKNILTEAERKQDFQKIKQSRRLLEAWVPMLPRVHAGLPLPPSAMVMLKDVVAFAPNGSLLLCLQETKGELWGELTDIKGCLQEGDISSALEDAPLIYVATMNEGSESVHLEALTSWDREVRDLLVQQAEVRVGFFRTKPRYMLDPVLMGTPCGDRKHLPPVALLGSSLDEKSILQLPERLTELLDDSEASCDVANALTWYPPERDEHTEPTQVDRQEDGEVGLLGSSWRWMSSGVASAYTWWNSQNEVTDDPVMCPNSMPHEPLEAEISEPSRLRETLGLTTGESRDDLPGWDDACAAVSATHSPPSTDIPSLAAELIGVGRAALGQETEEPKSGLTGVTLYSSMIARLQAETVFEPPIKLRTRRAVSVLPGSWKQENSLGRIYSIFQPDPTLYLPRLVGAPFSSDSIADGHWPLVTAPRRSTRQLRGELAQHPIVNPTAQVGLTTMSIELDLRELLPELLRYMRTLPDVQAFSADAMAAWRQYMDPLAVTLTARPCPLPSSSYYAQASPDGLCGGHVLYQAIMRWRSRCNMHRESAATRAIYKALFAGWRDRLLDETNWPGLEAQDRKSYVNILGAWLCEFDSKETDTPIHLSPTHWFPMSLVQLLGYDSGLRTWMMSDSTARNNPAYNYVSSDGSDPSQRKCRLSSLNELAKNDPAVQLQHFGYSANHYYPIPIPTVEQTDLESHYGNCQRYS
jgi:hypothetical protein